MALHMSLCWHTQGMFVPKLLEYGQMYDGLLAFIAMSAGGGHSVSIPAEFRQRKPHRQVQHHARAQ